MKEAKISYRVTGDKKCRYSCKILFSNLLLKIMSYCFIASDSQFRILKCNGYISCSDDNGRWVVARLAIFLLLLLIWLGFSDLFSIENIIAWFRIWWKIGIKSTDRLVRLQAPNLRVESTNKIERLSLPRTKKMSITPC